MEISDSTYDYEVKKAGYEKSVVRLDWVGKNLQDRYEVGIVSEVKENFSILEGATFSNDPDDPHYRQWKEGKGLYANNGAVISIIKRSQNDGLTPDLFIFLAPGNFKCYYPRWDEDAVKESNKFTWVVLKAHTKNTAGSVTIRNWDPRVPPNINFNYFQRFTLGKNISTYWTSDEHE